MTDEVESHHTEQLPICLWFVDKERNIREEFLEIEFCCGQRYNLERLKCLHKLLECKSEFKISPKKLLTAIVAVTI